MSNSKVFRKRPKMNSRQLSWGRAQLDGKCFYVFCSFCYPGPPCLSKTRRPTELFIEQWRQYVGYFAVPIAPFSYSNAKYRLTAKYHQNAKDHLTKKLFFSLPPVQAEKWRLNCTGAKNGVAADRRIKREIKIKENDISVIILNEQTGSIFSGRKKEGRFATVLN